MFRRRSPVLESFDVTLLIRCDRGRHIPNGDGHVLLVRDRLADRLAEGVLVILGRSLVDELGLEGFHPVEEGFVQGQSDGRLSSPLVGFAPQVWSDESVISLDVGIKGSVEIEICSERPATAPAPRAEVGGGADRLGYRSGLGSDGGGVSPHPSCPDRGGGLVGVNAVGEDEGRGVVVRGLVRCSAGCTQGSCSPAREACGFVGGEIQGVNGRVDSGRDRTWHPSFFQAVADRERLNVGLDRTWHPLLSGRC